MSIKNIPEWGQLVLALLALLVAGTLAFAKTNTAISLLEQKDTHFEQNIIEIKQMLREEIDRHHPRSGRP